MIAPSRILHREQEETTKIIEKSLLNLGKRYQGIMGSYVPSIDTRRDHDRGRPGHSSWLCIAVILRCHRMLTRFLHQALMRLLHRAQSRLLHSSEQDAALNEIYAETVSAQHGLDNRNINGQGADNPLFTRLRKVSTMSTMQWRSSPASMGARSIATIPKNSLCDACRLDVAA